MNNIKKVQSFIYERRARRGTSDVTNRFSVVFSLFVVHKSLSAKHSKTIQTGKIKWKKKFSNAANALGKICCNGEKGLRPNARRSTNATFIV